MKTMLLWMKLSLLAISITALPAQAGVGKKVKKAKKKAKKVVKKTNKASKKYFDEGKGITVDGFNKAVDYAEDDLKSGMKFAKNQYKKAKKQLEKWSQAALKAMFKNAFTREIKAKSTLAIALAKAAPHVYDDVLAIGNALRKGEMSKAEEKLNKLLVHPKLEQAIKLARKDFGTSLMAGLVGTGGGSYSKGVSIGGAASVIWGNAVNLDPGKVRQQMFFAAGGGMSLGLSSSPGASGSADVGLVLGFVKGDPTGALGTCFDGGAGVSIGGISVGFGMCFPLDFTKPLGKGFGAPSIFTVTVTRSMIPEDPKEALSVSGGISAGMSHTIGLGRVKQE